MNLARSQKIFKGIDYIGNFLNEPVELGNFYRCDDNSFILLGNIKNLVPDLSLENVTETGSKQDLSYSKESNVKLTIGGTANKALEKGEIALKFESRNSAFVALKDVTISQLRMQPLMFHLKQIWEEQHYDRRGGHIFVYQTLEAASGTVIFSKDRNNTVVLKSSDDRPLTKPRLSEGKIEYVANTKATLEIISPNPILPMFKALYITKKGQIENVG